MGVSGKTQSKDARRAAGRARLEVWITEEQRRRLEWLRAEDGYDFAATVGALIDAAYEERQSGAPDAKRPGRKSR